MRYLLALVVTLLLMPAARAQPVVVDGDTLKMNGTTYRLFGIDAPEMSQTCENGWMAGQYAAAVLRGLLNGRVTVCIPRDRDRYGRTVAICLADGIDVGAELVRQGMAWSFTRYSRKYEDLEAAAKAEGLGVHAHGCKVAWQYRQEKRN